MTFDVHSPEQMNTAFAEAFNHRDSERLLRLYEPGARLRATAEGPDQVGLAAVEETLAGLLAGLLALPGRMTSRNRFCLVHDDLALLRADWILVSDDGETLASGSSVELVRRQADGFWRYVIDHAVGASLPPLLPPLLPPPPLASSPSPSWLPGVARR